MAVFREAVEDEILQLLVSRVVFSYAQSHIALTVFLGTDDPSQISVGELPGSGIRTSGRAERGAGFSPPGSKYRGT